MFDKLPAELQKILFEVAEQWGIESDKAYMTAGDDGYRSLPEFKATLHELSRDEQVRWAKPMPNLAKEWAESMDKQGLPGTKALSMFMDELRKAGVTPDPRLGQGVNGSRERARPKRARCRRELIATMRETRGWAMNMIGIKAIHASR